MKTVLITGVTGQDGSYLADQLTNLRCRIIGAVHDEQKAQSLQAAQTGSAIEFVYWNMRSQQSMTDVLSQYRPTEIYNFAAHTSGTGMYDDAVGIGDVNGLAVARLLEAIRTVDTNIRFCQASSREIFGAASESPQSENAALSPRSPYGAAKLYADSMVRIYRQHHGLFACSAILFNHESPRRGLAFVTRKITSTAAKIKLGLACELRLGNLDARRDWGYAGDFVRAMSLMLQQPQADDYVIATGETHSVRDFCQVAFGHLQLDYRDFVQEDASAFRPMEPVELVGNASKAKRQLGWVPRVKFRELVGMMVDADVELLRKER